MSFACSFTGFERRHDDLEAKLELEGPHRAHRPQASSTACWSSPYVTLIHLYESRMIVIEEVEKKATSLAKKSQPWIHPDDFQRFTTCRSGQFSSEAFLGTAESKSWLLLGHCQGGPVSWGGIYRFAGFIGMDTQGIDAMIIHDWFLITRLDLQ